MGERNDTFDREGCKVAGEKALTIPICCILFSYNFYVDIKSQS